MFANCVMSSVEGCPANSDVCKKNNSVEVQKDLQEIVIQETSAPIVRKECNSESCKEEHKWQICSNAVLGNVNGENDTASKSSVTESDDSDEDTEEEDTSINGAYMYDYEWDWGEENYFDYDYCFDPPDFPDYDYFYDCDDYVDEFTNYFDAFPDACSDKLSVYERMEMTQILGEFAGACANQPSCQLCGHPCSPQNQAITVPCAHKFHNGCLFTRLEENGGICPSDGCGAHVAVAGDPIFTPTYYFFDAKLVEEFRNTDAKPTPFACLCRLCGESALYDERVITPLCCHMFHKTCFDQRVGIEREDLTLCPCPVPDCGRPCLEVKRIPPRKRPMEKKGKQSCKTPAVESDHELVNCSICRKSFQFGDSVRPNNCQHRFHRECLCKKTQHNKQCPVRKCKRKFRSIVQ